MIFDGENISPGDKVFDVLYGDGVVQELLAADRFLVRFGGGRTGAYAASGIGVRFTRKTLFWNDPIIVLPYKNNYQWLNMRPVLLTVIEAMRLATRGATEPTRSESTTGADT